MTPDHEQFALTGYATLIFGAIALFFGTLVRRTRRRLTPAHQRLVLVFRLWFGALALGTLYLTLFGKTGLFPR